MRDYALTTKILRSCAENSCDGCPIGGAEYTSKDCRKVHNDAADAIEELLAEKAKIENSGKLLAAAFERLKEKVPTWISVEDELPSRYETVLLNIQTCKDSYVTIGDYEPNELRFRDFADRNNQVYCGDIVTHWMPLPKAPAPPTEPPKGVE